MKHWNAHVNHPLQSWEWGLFRERTGVQVVRIEDTTIPYQFTLHKLPKVPWYIGYLPKGPAITKEMIQTLTDYGKTHNVIFFQLEPNITIQHSTGAATQNDILRQNQSNLKSSHHPLFTKYTFVLDLQKSEEELQTNMHPKTRYNIKVAQKHGVSVQEDNSDQAFEEYLRLTEETTKRQGFYAHSLQYHKTMWQTLSPSGTARLWTATYQGTTLAAWIVFVFKDTIYYPYGTSSREHRQVMAPYLLLWEITRWAKKQKYRYFDLWGALGPDPNSTDPFYGFHRFKAGFHPALVEFIGSFDLVINPSFYTLYCLADTIRWKVLKRT